MPNIVAWSQTSAQPAMPLASTTAAASLRVPEMPVTAVAPAPETMPSNRQRAPAFSQTAVAPAPEVDAESSRTLRAPQAAVVEPPPMVDAATARRLGDITIGHAQVVAPAPELPMAEQYAVSGRTQAGLGGGSAGASVVPPPPSIRAMPAPVPMGGSSRSEFIPPQWRPEWPCRLEIVAGLLPRLPRARLVRPALLIFPPARTPAAEAVPAKTAKVSLPD